MQDNPALDLLLKRRSSRDFDGRPVPPELLGTLLEAAARAPTAGNMMLYSILHIEDQRIKDHLAVSCDDQPFIARAPLVLVFLADYAKWMRYFEFCGLRGAGPAEADLFLAMDDAIIAAQNLVVAAESLGLSSCYIGDVMERFEEHRELLGFPKWCFPAAMLCVGYPSERQLAAPARARFPLDTLVFRDRYRELGPSDYAAMFDRPEYRSAKFPPGPDNCGRDIHARKFTSDFMAEMRRSVSACLEEWKGRS